MSDVVDQVLVAVFSDPDDLQAARWVRFYADLHRWVDTRCLATAMSPDGEDPAAWRWLRTDLFGPVDAATGGGLTLRGIGLDRFQTVAMYALAVRRASIVDPKLRAEELLDDVPDEVRRPEHNR